jgi:hypothetical protein
MLAFVRENLPGDSPIGCAAIAALALGARKASKIRAPSQLMMIYIHRRVAAMPLQPQATGTRRFHGGLQLPGVAYGSR